MKRKTTTYGVWTVKQDAEGFYENRGEGSDFPVTLCGIEAALTVAKMEGPEWTVVLEKRTGDAFRVHDMEDATVYHVAENGTFLGGVRVPVRIVKLCREAVRRYRLHTQNA